MNVCESVSQRNVLKEHIMIFLTFSNSSIGPHATYVTYDGIKHAFYDNNSSTQDEERCCFLLKALFFPQIQFRLTRARVKDWFLSPPFLLSFSIFSGEMEDVLPAAPPCESDILLYLFGNNIFCPRTYRQSNAAASEVSAGFPLERPCTTSNNGGWFQFDIVLFVWR